ncbi:hypothetical protein O4J56_00035 [Nocardiopsis sp. RSe5-2]|uniref:Uncharacterized protein n=1 Tax=Nocardiopsis endophytica TaxID=3018445 RepID=A0ABT4TWG4_9ACTN|nr:hypothetical protein [Nocardiopsis endophytica]MDA2809017.1 hypothetical protein [Nocardiopsis endophytica]
MILLVAAIVGAVFAFGLPTDVQRLYAVGMCRVQGEENCDELAGDAGPGQDGAAEDGEGAQEEDDSDGGTDEDSSGTDAPGGDGDGEEGGDGGDDGQGSDDGPVSWEGVYNPDLAQELEDAESELEDAEAALDETGYDEVYDELLAVVADIVGWTDAKACITEGDIIACLTTIVGFTPWGKGAKLISKSPKIIKLWNRFRKAKKARDEAKSRVDDAKGRRDDAARACDRNRPRAVRPATETVVLSDGATVTLDWSAGGGGAQLDPGHRPESLAPTDGADAWAQEPSQTVIVPAQSSNGQGDTCDIGNDYDKDDPYLEQDLEEDAALIARHSNRADELGFKDQDALADYIQKTIDPRNPPGSIVKKPKLKNGRIAWYDKDTGVIIIRNTNNPARSTVYKGTLDEFLRLS